MQGHSGRMGKVVGAAAVAWVGVMFFFSGQSGEDSGALSGGLTQMLFGWLIGLGVDEGVLEFLVRKAAHMTIFTIEGFLMGTALLYVLRRRTALWLATGGCAVIAVLNELHQLTSVARSCSVTDMLIDFAGALVGIAAAVILHAFSSKKNLHDR